MLRQAGVRTYGDIVVLFKLDSMCDLEVVDLLEKVESMADGRDLEVLEGIVVQVYKDVTGNLVFYATGD